MSDQMIRAITADGMVSACVISGAEIVERARQIHHTLPVATAALGRCLMAASLMGGQLKGADNSLTLRVQGGGPMGTIICVSDAEGNVRGCVGNPAVDLPRKAPGKLDVGGAVGADGSLTVIKDLGLKEPYVGSVPLCSGEIAEDVAAYFASSEQIPTACALGVLVERDQSVHTAGGYLIQLLPGADDAVAARVESGVARVGYVTGALRDGATPLELVRAVLSDFEVKVLETVPVVYRCPCTRERVESALRSLGKAELLSMAREQNGAELHCQFCGQSYHFDVPELEKLAEEQKLGK